MIPSVAAGGVPVGFRVTWDRIVPGLEQIPADIIPLDDDTYDLGSSDKYFASAFITTLTTDRINPTSGAGLGVNAAALDFATLALGGSFTSGGASDHAEAFTIRTALVGASGDTVALNLAAVGLGGGSVTTQGATETVGIVSSLYLAEPNITVGTGDTVTNAVTAYIAGAPTEGTNNYALWVDAGATQLDGTLQVGDAARFDDRVTYPFQNIGDGDTTPSVSGGRNFNMNNTAPTTITDFDDGADGQEIYVKIADNNTTIDFTSSGLEGNAGVNWTPAAGDAMRCVYDGTQWTCAIIDATA